MTRVLHLAGHNYKWNLESYIDHGIGDGIIFTAYSIPYQSYGKKLSGYKADLYKESSTIDLQFYGNKKSIGGKLSSYPFHPIHASSSSKTVIDGADQVEAAIKYQQNASIKNVIVPNFFYKDTLNTNKMLKRIHDRAMALKKKNEKFFMTLCFDKDLLLDELKIEYILQRATEMDIKFNGYYLVFENSVGYKQKISIDFKYYNNIYKILSTLKLQDFEVIVSYANFNALVFLSLCNIDYITIGTYENLRNFSIERFTEELSGGPSRGWFYSEKLLNFIKAEYIDFFRSKACANIIANDRNIFSNVILDDSFEWKTTHQPQIHKNYLLSANNQIKKLSSIKNIAERSQYFIDKIENAKKLYKDIATNYKIFLDDESADYHLSMWKSFIMMNL